MTWKSFTWRAEQFYAELRDTCYEMLRRFCSLAPSLLAHRAELHNGSTPRGYWLYRMHLTEDEENQLLVRQHEKKSELTDRSIKVGASTLKTS